MNVQSATESSFLAEMIQKQIVSLYSSEVYLSVDIKYVGVINEGSTRKMNIEMLRSAGIQCVWLALLKYPKC